ncbi:hypothetical protein CYPRO_3255 [Cyclonatronum proteinivorum]|uniref:Uncharacterized protein n=1 Tax=Cyclonatronum proteinivorum TaxID=1457365 RepID=A0A345UPT6_9BACT|nr:hypothetical protein [Cyclonatronum proteinivorum]AXJ02488.1 hypothetical protein CYPRO_3255 [Cyclonatronum proteinivorum]
MNKKVVYTLNVEDVQTVASEVIGRELKPHEVSQIENLIAEKINWFEAIEMAILEKIKK